jgi:hypothetical protein
MQLRKPYLLYLGDVQTAIDAKTAFGLRDWCPNDVVGEWSLPASPVTLGLPRLSPAEAAARGAGSIVIGIAPFGGVLPDNWLARRHVDQVRIVKEEHPAARITVDANQA